MKREHDFSQTERGKFFRPGATLHLPVYLGDDVFGCLGERAQSKGVEVAELVNEILRKDIALVESLR